MDIDIILLKMIDTYIHIQLVTQATTYWATYNLPLTLISCHNHEQSITHVRNT